jgi:hypothetical protein
VNCIALTTLDLSNNQLENVPLEFGVSEAGASSRRLTVSVSLQGLLSLRSLDLRGNSGLTRQIPEYLLNNSDMCIFVLTVRPLPACPLVVCAVTSPHSASLSFGSRWRRCERTIECWSER